ncbi:MAG: ATP-binding protein [Acidimicrobiales bacterium]
MSRPTGIVAFLFTDIVGSTRLWEEHPAAMDAALASHDRIWRIAVETEGGFVFSTAGDGLSAAFNTPAEAVRVALAAQRALAAETWPEGAALSVRVGIHAGTARERDGDYFGPALNRTARLMSLARGGEVLVSQAVQQLIRGDLPPDVSLFDLGDRVLRGIAEPERTFQLRAPGLVATAQPHPSSSGMGNLPWPPTSFVGRYDEVKAVVGELARRRVVTIAGPGGMGKTRLAIEVAHAAADEFPDGAWFCELAAVEGSGVAPTVAAAVGAVLRLGHDHVQQIVDAVAERRALVVLDNCEHVLDQAAEVARRIAGGSPAVRVLCTSREPLHIAGEQLWRLGGLADAAVELFYERAGDQQPGFTPNAAEVAAVEELCRRLDGMPLAIELAAARARSLSPVDIAARLDERFRLLRTTARGTPERQQTLRGTVQWSYDLLEPAERTVFERLSVFAGSFSLAAAEAVCANEEFDTIDVFDTLDALVDRSIVARRPSVKHTRFVLLETLRQFAGERLTEPETCQLAHARYYRDLAVAEERRSFTADEAGAWETLDEEWDNIRAAYEYGTALGERDVVAEIPAALGYYGLHALRGEVGVWAKTAIESGLLAAHPVELDVRGAWAMAAYWLGANIDEARRALGMERGSAAFPARVSHPLGSFMVAQASGEWDRADRLTAAWLEASREWPPGPGAVHAAGARALYGAWGDISGVDALAFAMQASTLAHDSGSLTLRGWGHWFRGLVLIYADPDAAIRAFEETVEAVTSLGEAHFVRLGGLVWLNVAAVVGDDLARALSTTRDLLGLADTYRMRNVTLQLLRSAALALARAGQPVVAARLLGAADATGHTGGPVRQVTAKAEALVRDALGGDADAHIASGASLDVAAARTLALDAISEAEANQAHRDVP